MTLTPATVDTCPADKLAEAIRQKLNVILGPVAVLPRTPWELQLAAALMAVVELSSQWAENHGPRGGIPCGSRGIIVRQYEDKIVAAETQRQCADDALRAAARALVERGVKLEVT